MLERRKYPGFWTVAIFGRGRSHVSQMEPQLVASMRLIAVEFSKRLWATRNVEYSEGGGFSFLALLGAELQ